MYIGDATEAAPTPSPPRKRKARKEYQLQARALPAAPEHVGGPPDDEGAHDGPDEGAGDGEAEPEAAQVVDGLEGRGGPRDDGSVEAEEETAERGDDGAPGEGAGELR